MRRYLYVLAAAVYLSACAPAAQPTATNIPPTVAEASPTETSTATMEPSRALPPFELTSPSFESEGSIPKEFACTGSDLAPELKWGDPPEGTQSLALIFNDPDARSQGWVHWVVFNLPAELRSLPEGQSADAIPEGSVNGASGWGTVGYRGPCPPVGSTHRYVFSLYALDIVLDMPEGSTRTDLLTAMEGHVLAEAELAANFGR